ncbi:MAG: hypothetical protein QOI38_2814 [Sphingomonadales bacterium]|jgi:hypothetical protein|nr:hypothetical protein [Sphingomonadales bacterium]
MYLTVYGIAIKLALVGWALLLVSLFLARIRRFAWPLAQFVIPAIFGLLYVLMVWDGRHALDLPGSFTTFPGIDALFQNDSALTAAWIHIMAMDMFAGAWIAQDGIARGVPLILLLLLLILTFAFGPSGLLLYILARFALRPRTTNADEA